MENRYLGTIDPSSPDVWDGELLFSGRAVSIDLTLDGPNVSPEALGSVLARLDDVAALDGKARAALRADAEEGPDASTPTYCEHHREELDEEVLRETFGTTDRRQITTEAVLGHLHLMRIGLYPEAKDAAILLDYSLGEDVTDYVLCVSLDLGGDVVGIEMES